MFDLLFWVEFRKTELDKGRRNPVTKGLQYLKTCTLTDLKQIRNMFEEYSNWKMRQMVNKTFQQLETGLFMKWREQERERFKTRLFRKWRVRQILNTTFQEEENEINFKEDFLAIGKGYKF